MDKPGAILLRIGARPDVRIWRQNSGSAQIGNRYVHFGVKGCADISGLVMPHGRRLEIEVKSPTGRQRREQVNFQRMIEKRFFVSQAVILATLLPA